MAKVKKVFNKFISCEVLTGTNNQPTLSVMYEHYKEAEIKEVVFITNSETMDDTAQLEYLEAVKKTLDSNTTYAMWKLSKRQKAGELKSTYEVETEADDQADSLFIA